MKKRYDFIDLLKFIAVLAVIVTHIFNLGIPWGSYPFSVGWIFVEFFFIVTGYFTTLHFLPLMGEGGADERMKRSLQYTYKKFIRMVPYSTFVIAAEYIFGNLGLLQEGKLAYLKGFANMPFEMVYLSCATSHTPRAASVWFISAMFLVFPVYCCLLQMKSRNWLRWLSFIAPVLYYCYFDVIAARNYPHDLLRAFTCMMIGTWLCLSQADFNRLYRRIRSKALLTALEVGAFAFVVVAAYRNSAELMKLCVPAFMLTVSIIFSDMSYTANFSSPVFRWTTRISMPLFMWNWTIATIIRAVAPSLADGAKVAWYLALSCLVPLAHYFIVEAFKKSRARKAA